MIAATGLIQHVDSVNIWFRHLKEPTRFIHISRMGTFMGAIKSLTTLLCFVIDNVEGL